MSETTAYREEREATETTGVVEGPMERRGWRKIRRLMHEVASADTARAPFAQFVKDQVIDLIGMTGSCFCQPLPTNLDANAARAYEWQDRPGAHRGQAEAKWHVYPELYAAACGGHRRTWRSSSSRCSYRCRGAPVESSLESPSRRW